MLYSAVTSKVNADAKDLISMGIRTIVNSVILVYETCVLIVILQRKLFSMHNFLLINTGKMC